MGGQNEAARFHHARGRLDGISFHRKRTTTPAHRRPVAWRRRAQGAGWRRRHGSGPRPRHLSRGVRVGRHRRRPSPAARFAVSYCFDDQSDHLGRGDAAHGAGPLHPRRSRGAASSSAGQAPGVRVVRCGDRCLQAAAGDQVHHRTPPLHAHQRPGLRLHEPDGPRFQAARGRGISSRPSGVRARREMALQHQHRLARPPGREGLRPVARGLFPSDTSSTRSRCPTPSITCRKTSRPES